MTLSKSRTVIGRKGADFALNDPEVSRHHCLLEVREDFVNLKDMDSTNGTFFEEERVRAAILQDGAEFRVGSSTIRLSFHRIQRVSPLLSRFLFPGVRYWRGYSSVAQR